MKLLFTITLFLLFFQFAFPQGRPDSSFSAFRHGIILNPKTRQWDTMILCGQTICADTLGFFTMQSGCERNIRVLLGRYTCNNDTFHITPFDFIKEPAFLSVRKIPAKGPVQKIQFFTADFNPIKGVDSSWVIRLFRRKKSFFVDKTGENVISVKRKQYDGMELLQLTKLSGFPVILFFDQRFDYKIVVNFPKDAVERYITGGGSMGGVGVIRENSFYLNKDPDSFRITERGRKSN